MGATPGDDASGDFLVGGRAASQRYQGSIGFLAGWNVMLTFAQMLELQPYMEWLAGLGPRPAVIPAIPDGNILFCTYGGERLTVIDHSAYGHHGTVTAAQVVAPLPVPLYQRYAPIIPGVLV
jgi:hypothetical protein